MMWFDPGLLQYSEKQGQQFFEQVADRARLVPGVKSVTLTSFVPMDGGSGPVTAVPEGFQFPTGTDSATFYTAMVDEQYFDTLGLSILKGRGFQTTDSATSPRVAVVNEQVAQHYWPGQDPVGKRFRLHDGRGPWVEIVGLVKTRIASRALTSVFPAEPDRAKIDLFGFLLVASAVLVVTLLAVYVPARKASRINPTEALRCE